MISSVYSQDLKELKEYLLEGVKSIEPQAIECIEGTRTSILADVIDKTNDRNGLNTIWIRGAPGSGKSSISLTAKSRLRARGQLITYFRFDRNEASATTATALWRRVAYDLARRLPSLRMHFLEQLRDDTIDLYSTMAVFTSLIEIPLSKMIDSPVDRPLVIVIDAVDECGGLAGHLSPDRQKLLQTLKRWFQLPKHFKLLVTSRPESDITRVLSSISTFIEIPSGHFLTENAQAKISVESSNDIRTFLEIRFQATRERLSLPTDWPGSKVISSMVSRAAGVFMWATTAANFIDLGIDPKQRLRSILDNLSDSDSMRPLYSLYAVVLEMAFGELRIGGREAELLQFVLGTMVLAKRPLDDGEYMKLPTPEPITEDMLNAIKDGLRSVITPGTLRFIHKSFDDFLLSEECPPKYAIRKDESQYLLASLCVTMMSQGLYFNMCGLETSTLKNVDVPEIETKVANGISPLLSYSCRFLTDHLFSTPFDEYLMGQVREMIMDKLLYWFEAMSLLRELNRVPHSLLLLLRWLHLSPDDGFNDFLHDACRFIRAFGQPIAQSAPHIYISALPFAPERSSVARHFLPQYPWIIALSTGKLTDWSSCIFTSEYRRDNHSCPVFSPDEKLFVSTGSSDKTVCVYDSELGNLISGPFSNTEKVLCVFFDPDGHRVWASYNRGEVICWDTQTGDKHLAFSISESVACCRFNSSGKIISASQTTIALWNSENGNCEAHRNPDDDPFHELPRMVSISPDGCYVAYVGQDGMTIWMWKVVDGGEIQITSHPHPQIKHKEWVSALSFSVDDNFVLGGFEGGGILIWDATTGDAVGCRLDTVAKVDAVAYCSKKCLLLSSSGGTGTVMVWNALAQEAVLEPLEDHTARIFDIILFHDGRRALTTSDDGTMKMWDLGDRRGDVAVTDANEGQTSPVRFIAFSPCGKRFASVDRQAIRVWDVERTCKPLLKISFDKVSVCVKIKFSPDGGKIVGYAANDSTVGVWNADTGELSFHHELSGGIPFDHVSFRSTDQRLVIAYSTYLIVQIWDLENGGMDEDLIIASNYGSAYAMIVDLSPDGLTAIVYDGNRIPHHYLWSTTTHQPLPLTFADDNLISAQYSDSMVYSTSGRFIASTQGETTSGQEIPMVRVWSTRTGELVAPLLPLGSMVSHLAMSLDDHHIAISYRTCASTNPAIGIYDIRTGRMVSEPWGGHSYDISTLTFSPDGEKLVSGSRDRQIRVWNTADLIGNLQATVGFLGVGTHMVDGWVQGADGELLFWVPKEHRVRLVWPQSVLVGGNGMTTELDLSKFRYGDNWAECFVERK